MLMLAALALTLAGPPPATVDGKPLAVSSWCWGTRCGAPIAASTRVVRVHRGATVRVSLAFVPTQVQLAIAGKRQLTVTHGRELDWRAARSGGISLRVVAAKGWVTYVGRLAVS